VKKKNYRTIFLFGAAVLLLLGSVAGSSQAALTYYSENYSAQLKMDNIGVTLIENDDIVSARNYTGSGDKWDGDPNGELLTGMLGVDEKLILGKGYEERLSVRNSGTIEEYVRVMIYRYWEKDGTEGKLTDLSPDFIDLNLLRSQGWVQDMEASTRERIVLYYTKILPVGAETPEFSDFLRIDEAVAEAESEGQDGAGLVNDYDGIRFRLAVDVDAVQTHNAEDAIKSAWGIEVSVNEDGSLNLKGTEVERDE
jgi:hypothetical protein